MKNFAVSHLQTSIFYISVRRKIVRKDCLEANNKTNNRQRTVNCLFEVNKLTLN